MKDKILEIIKKRPAASFVDLEKIDGFLGEYEMFNAQYNVVYWGGISLEATEAMNELIANKQIEMALSVPLVYMIDGRVMKYPLVKSLRVYKNPHWLPVVFWIPEDLRRKERKVVKQ